MLTINCRGKLLSLTQPVVMGIINVNNASFYAGSRTPDVNKAVDVAANMLKEGASILDIGGQSTAPNSILISADDEWRNVAPVIKAIRASFPEAILSIDTFYAKVAENAVICGASMVNDISGGMMDTKMTEVVGTLNVPYIIMHMKGTPQTMQTLAKYDNITLEVIDYFIQRIEACLQSGIKDLLVDPGYGFAKTITQNLELLQNSDALKMLGKPIVTGISRKSTVYKTLGVTAEEALNGSTVLHTIALQKGTNILRVHDVKEAIEAIRLVAAAVHAQNHVFKTSS